MEICSGFDGDFWAVQLQLNGSRVLRRGSGDRSRREFLFYDRRNSETLQRGRLGAGPRARLGSGVLVLIRTVYSHPGPAPTLTSARSRSCAASGDSLVKSVEEFL